MTQIKALNHRWRFHSAACFSICRPNLPLNTLLSPVNESDSGNAIVPLPADTGAPRWVDRHHKARRDTSGFTSPPTATPPPQKKQTYRWDVRLSSIGDKGDIVSELFSSPGQRAHCATGVYYNGDLRLSGRVPVCLRRFVLTCAGCWDLGCCPKRLDFFTWL